MLWMTALLSGPSWAGPVHCVRMPRGTAYERPFLLAPVSLRSEAYPIRVWHAAGDLRAEAIADAVLDAAERSWAIQVDTIGFRPPTLPDAEDGPEFDVYLVEYYEEAAYVAADPGPDPERGDGYSSISSYMVVDHRLPLDLVDAYVAHELNHASQWSYDWTESTLPLWEGTATAAERWTLGDDYDWALPVPSFQEVPWMPALVGSGSTAWQQFELGYFYEYGASLWVMWLDEAFGDGAGAGGVALWEATASEGRRREPDVVDAFAEVAGGDLLGALGELAAVRWWVGDEWAPGGLIDAPGWEADRRVAVESFDVGDLPLDRAPGQAPFVTGQAFALVDLRDAAFHRRDVLQISAPSDAGLGTALTVLWWTDGGEAGSEVVVGDPPTLELPAPGVERLLVAISNGGPRGWDGDDGPYLPGDQRWVIDVVRDRGCGCAPASGPMPAGAAVGLVMLGLLGRRRSARDRQPAV